MNFNAGIDAVVRRMAQDSVGLLIACSNGLQMPDLPDPVAHLSGYRSLGESFVLLCRDGISKIIVTPAADAERAAAWRGLHTSITTDDLIGALTRELADRRKVARSVAIIGIDAFPHFL